jgi:hypothetical protein
MTNTQTQELHSTRRLTIALARGIIEADPFFRGYEPPPGYERVLRDFAAGFDSMEEENGAFYAPDEEVRRNIFDFIHTHPICVGWNQWGGATADTIAVTSRYSPRPKGREFIDLDAIAQNTWHAVIEEREASLRTDVAIMERINARKNAEG